MNILQTIRRAAMTALAIAWFALGSAGCGGNPVAELENIADEACACNDMKCVEGVQKKMEKLSEKYRDEKEPSEADMKQLGAAMQKMVTCIAKIQTEELGAAVAAPPPPNIADEACACNDMKCVEGVQKKMEKLSEKYRDEKEPSEADMKQLGAAMQKMMTCIAKIQTEEIGAAVAAPPPPSAAVGEPPAVDETGPEASPTDKAEAGR